MRRLCEFYTLTRTHTHTHAHAHAYTHGHALAHTHTHTHTHTHAQQKELSTGLEEQEGQAQAQDDGEGQKNMGGVDETSLFERPASVQSVGADSWAAKLGVPSEVPVEKTGGDENTGGQDGHGIGQVAALSDVHVKRFSNPPPYEKGKKGDSGCAVQ